MNFHRVMIFSLSTALVAWFFLSQGCWMSVNPAYWQSNLEGLTPEQVIERLGEPRYYSRKPRGSKAGDPRWTNEEENGTFSFLYTHGWNRCTVIFKNGRVAEVHKMWK